MWRHLFNSMKKTSDSIYSWSYGIKNTSPCLLKTFKIIAKKLSVLIAQLIELHTGNPKVHGSNLPSIYNMYLELISINSEKTWSVLIISLLSAQYKSPILLTHTLEWTFQLYKISGGATFPSIWKNKCHYVLVIRGINIPNRNNSII